MTTKHTPGPCYVISRHRNTINIESATGAILGMSMKTDQLTSEEVRANAMLWAAAPDLLEACQFLLKTCNAEGMDVSGGADEDAYDQALAAIAKATDTP